IGRLRLISQRNIGIVPWPKYSSPAMKKAFQDVTNQRSEKSSLFSTVTFPSRPGCCNTDPILTSTKIASSFVTTMKYERTKGSVGGVKKTCLIRSFDHYERKQLQMPRVLTGASNKYSGKNFGPADTMEIWEVACAATAAPMYFKEVKKKSNDGTTKFYYSDGGFGHTNNPTQLGIQEIETLHGKGNIGVVVSVGTARANDSSRGKNIFKRVKDIADTATDPKIVAEQLHTRELYWRLNDDEGLSVELDEWKPNNLFTRRPGRKTLATIQQEFYRWASERNNITLLEHCARELVRRRRKRVENGSR
ncbi:hypothetical protein K505DRAFT_236549, partial [Melanomma pulvis-pyrius CBS 109.77]